MFILVFCFIFAVMEKLKALLLELSRSQAGLVVDSATSFLAAIDFRVRTKRVDTKGRPYSKYTDSYAKFRESKNRRTDRKDFNLTGQLWDDIEVDIESVEKGSNGVSVSITPSTQRSKDVLKGNEKREGEILFPSDEVIKEQEELASF